MGAGSAGLLLAALLHRHGHRVSVFEKADGVRTDGCGILLVKSGVEAIAASAIPGLLDRLLAEGLPVSRFVVRNLRGEPTTRGASYAPRLCEGVPQQRCAPTRALRAKLRVNS